MAEFPEQSAAVQRVGRQRFQLPSFQIYFLARGITAVASFAVLKLLVEMLTRDQYGDWGYLRSVGAVLVPLLSLSLPASMQRFYFDSENPADRAEVITTVLQLSLAAAMVVALVGVVGGAVGIFGATTSLFVAGSIPAVIVLTYFDYLARTVDAPGRYLLNRLMEFGPLLVGLLIVVVTNPALSTGTEAFGALWWAVTLLVASQWVAVVANVVLGDSAWAGFLRRAPGSGDPLLARSSARVLPLVRFSAPLAGTFLIGWILSSSDVVLLRHLADTGEVADYVLAVGVVAFVTLVTQAALIDWPPFFYQRMSSRSVETDRQVSRRLQLVLIAHVCALVGLRMLTPLAYRLLGADEFIAGQDLVALLGLGNYLYLLGSMLAIGISHAKRTHLTIVIFGLPAVVNIVLNVVWIPSRGADAAAMTTVASYVLFAALSLVIGARCYRFTELGRIALITVVAAIVTLV